METPSNQQLCALGKPADGGESHSIENVNTDVAASDHHGDFMDDADADQKVLMSLCPRDRSMNCDIETLFVAFFLRPSTNISKLSRMTCL